MPDIALRSLALAFIMLAPVVTFLRFNAYDFSRTEAALLIGGCFLLGFLLSIFIALRPSLLRPLCFTALIVLFIDLQNETKATTEQVIGLFDVTGMPGDVLAILAISVVILIILTLIYVLQRNAEIIVLAFFGVFVVGALVFPPEQAKAITEHRIEGPKATARNPDLRPIVHIVLDEHLGLRDVTGSIPGAPDLRQGLITFFADHGFQVFDRSFSQYVSTVYSLANLMNGQLRFDTDTYVDGSEDNYALTENLWFRDLAQRGYKIRVYQSDFLDFCSAERAAIEYCLVYPANSINSLIGSGWDAGTKLKLITITLFSQSILYRVATSVYNQSIRPLIAELGIDLPQAHPIASKLGAIPSLDVTDRLIADLASGAEGTVYFAHLLIPHRSFIYDEGCSLKTDLGALHMGDDSTNLSEISAETRVAGFREYFKQVRCTYQKLGRLLESMNESGILDRALIIIHGDHGSRLGRLRAEWKNRDRLTEADIIDGFGTVFAVKSDELQGGINSEPRSIQALFADLLLQQSPSDETALVHLESDPETGQTWSLRWPLANVRE